MRYLFDTNAVIALMKGHTGLLKELRKHSPQDFAVSSIAMHELFYGAYKSERVDQNLARIEALRFAALEFDQEDARSAGRIRAELKLAGTPIGPYDVLIAGQALARGLILITHNTREFGRIEGLRLEDWER